MKLRHLIYPAEQWGGETEFDPGFWLREAWYWLARRPWYWLRERLWPSPARPDEGAGLHGLHEDLSDLIYSMPPQVYPEPVEGPEAVLAEWQSDALKEKH